MVLAAREKRFLIIGAVLLGLAAAFQLFVRPAISQVRTLRRVVAEQRQVLGELTAKSQEYKALQSKLQQLRKKIGQQHEERHILSFVERVQKDSGLLQKVVYMKPATSVIGNMYEETSIEVKFGSVTLDQIIQFLLKLETSELLVGVRSLDVRRGVQNPNLLDAVIQVASLAAIEE
jgi:type II secretory pathway component PulM